MAVKFYYNLNNPVITIFFILYKILFRFLRIFPPVCPHINILSL